MKILQFFLYTVKFLKIFSKTIAVQNQTSLSMLSSLRCRSHSNRPYTDSSYPISMIAIIQETDIICWAGRIKIFYVCLLWDRRLYNYTL